MATTDPDTSAVALLDRGGVDLTPILELVDVRKVYGMGDTEVAAVDGVSFAVAPGDFVAITGPSGSGKSTLLQLVGLLDRPTSGEIRFRGESVGDLRDARLSTVRNREVGFVFQSFHLLPRATALANVELPLVYRGVPRAERRARALEALQRVGLGDRVHHLPNQMSGGQRQRVAIARALVTSPGVILADEPTGNLDSTSSAEVMELLVSLNRDLGVAVVLITHEADVAAHARREIRMRDGHIVDVRDRDDDPERADVVAAADVDEGRAGLRGRDLLRMGFGALRGNRLRTALTSLGVIIGVASVVILLAVAAGARDAITSGIESLGSNQVLVFPGDIENMDGGFTLPPDSPIRLEHVEELAEAVGSAGEVTASADSSAQVSAGPRRTQVSISGTTDNYARARGRTLVEGQYFDAGDVATRERVAILGAEAADVLFPSIGAVGREITVQGARFDVIGVFEKTEGGFELGFSQDNFVYLPITSFQDLTGNRTIDTVQAQAPTAETVEETQAIIEDYLAEEFPDSDFSVLGQDQMIGLASQFLDIFTVFLAGIATVSLLVGGIGIMNVTLVSVTERTREIGVRRAIGARSRDVLGQFLFEAVVTSLVGGAVGLAAATVAAMVVAAASPIPAEVAPWMVAMALGMSIVTGVLSGVWPARRAARLDPVEALRHE
ncbi:MAG TPA: ABC transporter permease [Acidimicrobiales bacterium]|nr:ABC transporter permease [Acidimicrobiales bacterium]